MRRIFLEMSPEIRHVCRGITACCVVIREADERFAELIDYFRDYRDCASDYAECDKFAIYDELQEHIDALRGLDVSLCYATRKVAIKGLPDAKPWPTTVLYLIAFPLGKEPTEFSTSRSVPIGW